MKTSRRPHNESIALPVLGLSILISLALLFTPSASHAEGGRGYGGADWEVSSIEVAPDRHISISDLFDVQKTCMLRQSPDGSQSEGLLVKLTKRIYQLEEIEETLESIETPKDPDNCIPYRFKGESFNDLRVLERWAHAGYNLSGTCSADTILSSQSEGAISTKSVSLSSSDPVSGTYDFEVSFFASDRQIYLAAMYSDEYIERIAETTLDHCDLVFPFEYTHTSGNGDATYWKDVCEIARTRLRQIDPQERFEKEKKELVKDVLHNFLQFPLPGLAFGKIEFTPEKDIFGYIEGINTVVSDVRIVDLPLGYGMGDRVFDELISNIPFRSTDLSFRGATAEPIPGITVNLNDYISCLKAEVQAIPDHRNGKK